MDNLPNKENLTVNEVAVYIGVSTQTVRNWIKAGDIIAFKIRGTMRVKRDSIICLCENKLPLRIMWPRESHRIETKRTCKT